MIYGNYLRNKYNNAAVKLADAEGVPCIMEYSKGKNMRNYEIYGNSVQNGTPSPGNPIEVQSVGDLTKNLLCKDDVTVGNVTSCAGKGAIWNPGRSARKFGMYFKVYGIKPNTTYTMVNYMRDIYWMNRIIECNENDICTVNHALYTINNVYDDSKNKETYTFTTNTETKYMVVQYIRIDKQDMTQNDVSELRSAIFEGSFTSNTKPEYEPYHKYKVPIKVCGKNLLPNSNWMSGANNNGFDEKADVDYITEYTQNSISFNLTAWTGVSSPRFRKDSVKRIMFKVNQDAVVSDSNANFYISIQAYDDNNTKTGDRVIYANVVADTEYVFDISASSAHTWYAKSTQFSFCILARNNVSNLMVYDIAYYADTDTAKYEPYHKPITTHIYLDEPLRKVGDYADYIDSKNQKVVRNIFKQSLNKVSIYKKLNSVIRLGGRNESARQKYDTHMLSTIFNYHGGDWFGNTECIFHHNNTNWNYYWSIYWNRLGLTYDGTNVYRTDDTSQTPLTDSEIISIANQWLSTLPDKDKEIYMILDTPTEESVSLPTLKTFKGTSIMSVNTSIQPSNIKTKYVIS